MTTTGTERKPVPILEIENAVSDLVDRAFLPWLKIRKRDDLIPENIVIELRHMGLFGVNIPEEYGGLGLGQRTIAITVKALSRGSIALASLVFSHCKVNSYLCNGGTEEQKRTWLPRLASGELIAAHGLTEPTGKSVADFTTVLQRDEDIDSFTLDGCKSFVTNAGTAGLHAIVARREDEGGPSCSIVLLEAERQGLGVGEEIERVGLDEVSLCPVSCNDIVVEEEDILGGSNNEAAKMLAGVRPAARLNYAARSAGIATRAFEEADEFIRNKHSSQKLLVDIPAVRLRLAEMRSKVSCINMMLRDLAGQLQEGDVELIDACTAKIFCSQMAGEVVRSALEIHGGAGFASGLPIGKLYRDVQALNIVGTPNDIILNDIADMLVGLEAGGGEIIVGNLSGKGAGYEY